MLKTEGILPRITADTSECDEDGYVQTEYLNAFEHFRVGQLVTVEDSKSGNSGSASVARVHGDTLWLDLW